MLQSLTDDQSAQSLTRRTDVSINYVMDWGSVRPTPTDLQGAAQRPAEAGYGK